MQTTCDTLGAPQVTAMMRSGRTALHLASEAGREEMVRTPPSLTVYLQPQVSYLLSHDCPVDSEDLMGRQTALSLAVRGGHQSVARRLLEHGASPLAVVEGRTVQQIMRSASGLYRLALVSGRSCQTLTPTLWPSRSSRRRARSR